MNNDFFVSKYLGSIRNIAILPTFECDIVCKHCVFNSSPKLKELVDWKHLEKSVKKIIEITNVESITVSGGEATLHKDYLISLSKICLENNLRFNFVTNCSFANTLESATEFLSEFKSILISKIAISWDSFHEKFISPENIRNCIKACRKLNISVSINVVSTKTKRIGDALSKIGEESYELNVVEVPCLPVGRAKKAIHKDEFLPTPNFSKNRACKSDFDTVTISPEGNIYPCCAVGGFTDGIKAGNIYEEDVSKILERIATDFRWQILSNKGPRFFLNFLTPDEIVSLDISTEMHDCVICNRIFESKLKNEIVHRATDSISKNAFHLFSKISNE